MYRLLRAENLALHPALRINTHKLMKGGNFITTCNVYCKACFSRPNKCTKVMSKVNIDFIFTVNVKHLETLKDNDP